MTEVSRNEVSGFEIVSSALTLRDGKYYITVSYEGKTAEAEVEVTPVALAKIFASYNQGGKEIFTSTDINELADGLTVTGINNDGTAYVGAITGYALSGELTAGRCEITVTYSNEDGTFTAVFTVEVKAVEIKSVTATYKGNPVYSTADIDGLKRDIEVVVTYNDGSADRTLTASEYGISGKLTAGGNSILTITYNGKTGSVAVPVLGEELTGITAIYSGTDTVYSSTALESLKNDLAVTAKFGGGVADKLLEASEYTLSGDLTEGACKITVCYNGQTAVFTVTVVKVDLVQIKAVYTGGTVYATADLDALRDDIVVTAYYSDGNHKIVTEYSFAPITLVEGDNVVTVSYLGKTDNFSLGVAGVKLDGISASLGADAPKIYAGTDVNELKQWLTVVASYTDGKQAQVYDYTLEGTLEAGKTCVVTVTYSGKSATFDVTVEKRVLDHITAHYNPASGTTVYANSTLDDIIKFVTVDAYYTTGDPDIGVEGFTLSGTIVAGPVTVTVHYGNKTDTFVITVSETPTLSRITAVFEQGNTVIYNSILNYASFDSLKPMLEVTAHYTDSSTGYASASKILADGDYTVEHVSGGTFRVVYKGYSFTAPFTVNLTKVRLDSITAVFNPENNVIKASTPLPELKNYITISGLNNDGTPAVINSYDITGDLVAGTVSKITITSNGVSTVINVPVASDMAFDHITVTFAPSAVGPVYAGSDADILAKGLVVTAHYTDGVHTTTRAILYPNYEIICALDTAGEQAVTVKYLGKIATATVKVEVLAIKIAELSVSFNQNNTALFSGGNATTLEQFKDYIYGANPKLTLNVVGICNDGSFAGTVNAGDYTISLDFTQSNEVTVTLNSDPSVKASFNVILIDNSFNGIAQPNYDGATIYESAVEASFEEFKKHLTVYALYNAGQVLVSASDYTITCALVSEEGDYKYYDVTVEYGGDAKTVRIPVTKVKLTGATHTLGDTSNALVYDSMTPEEAVREIGSALTIMGSYNDSSYGALSVNDFDISGVIENGKYKITLTHKEIGGITVTFETDVIKVALSELDARYTPNPAVHFFVSQTLDEIMSTLDRYGMLSVTAIYNNGDTKVLGASHYAYSCDSLTGSDKLSEGSHTIVISYTHNGVTRQDTFDINVEAVAVDTLKAELKDGEKVYTTTTADELRKKLTVVAGNTNGSITIVGEKLYTFANLPADAFMSLGSQTAVNSFTLEVTYGGKKAEVTFDIYRAVTSIDLSGIADSYDFDPSKEGSAQGVTSGAKLTENGKEVTGKTLVYSGNTFTTYSELTNGELTITVTFAGDSVYASSTASKTVKVNKAKVNLDGFNAMLDNKAYDGNPIVYDNGAHDFAMGASLPNGVASITQVYGCTYNGNADSGFNPADPVIKNVGVYTLTVTFTYNENYTGDATKTYTLEITKADTKIDSVINRTFTYNGFEQVFNGITITQGDDAETQTVSYRNKADTSATAWSTDGFKFTHVNEGNGVIVEVRISGTRNYNSYTQDIALIVNKADLEITVDDQTMVYGGSTADLPKTVTYDAVKKLLGTDTEASLGIEWAFVYSYTNAGGIMGDVGEYEIGAEQITLDDYNVNITAGKLTVTPKPVDITWLQSEVTYDGAEHKPVAQFVNIYNNTVVITGVTLTGTADGELTDGKAINAGTYTATATSPNKNYSFNNPTETFTVKKAAISVDKSGDVLYHDASIYNDVDKLIVLDEKDQDGKFLYIHIVGDQNAVIEIAYTEAYVKGGANRPEDEPSSAYKNVKPMTIAGAGSYVINYRITVANHETYFGQWSLDIINDSPDAKFVQIIVLKPIELVYGDIPASAQELKELQAKLYDEGYIDTAKLKLDREQYLANLNLVLKVDNDTAVDGDTDWGNYTLYFTWVDGTEYETQGWIIAYKSSNAESDSNVSKVEVVKKVLQATWSQTEFISNNKLHLPTLTVSGFDDGDFVLELTDASGGEFTLNKDGRELKLTVTITGNLTSAGAHIITLTLDNANYDLQGAITSISISAPAIITVSSSETSYTADGTVHLPVITFTSGEYTATLTLTENMLVSGGATSEVNLGGNVVKVRIEVTGSGVILKDAGTYIIKISIDDERYTLPQGEISVTVSPAPAPAEKGGMEPWMIAIIAIVAVLAVIVVIVLIVVIKRKPQIVNQGNDDGFDDYYEE